jgi:hypothetical protein
MLSETDGSPLPFCNILVASELAQIFAVLCCFATGEHGGMSGLLRWGTIGKHQFSHPLATDETGN